MFNESIVFTDFCSAVDAHRDTNHNLICYLDDVRWIIHVQYIPTRVLDPVSWHNIKGDTSPAELLEFLFLAGGTDRSWEANRTDLPAIIRGLETAIREQNQQGLWLLLCLQSTLRSSDPQSSRETSDGAPRVHLTAETMTKLLHLAIRQGVESSWLVDMLLDCHIRRDLVPKNDRVVMKWAIWRLKEAERGKRRFGGWSEYEKWLSEY